MPEKPAIVATVTNVGAVMVSADGKTEAVLVLEVETDQELRLHVAPDLVAKLEAMLAKANAEQAKHQRASVIA